MPPRYSYWTILAGGLPTAFRATEREELLPTFRRIKHKHPDAEMKWFARGRLWASPEEAHNDLERARERRNRDWRPGGDHRDPRQKYKDAKQARNLSRRKTKFDRKGAAAGHKRGPSSERPRGNGPNPPRDSTRPHPKPSPDRGPHHHASRPFNRDGPAPSTSSGGRPQLDGPRPRLDESRPRLDESPRRFDKPRPRLDESRPHPDKPRPRLDESRPHPDKPRPRLDESPPRFDKPRPRLDESRPRLDGPRPRLDENSRGSKGKRRP